MPRWRLRLRLLARAGLAPAPWLRLGVGLAVALVTLLLQAVVWGWISDRVPFMFFLPAIVLAGLVAGRVPAVLVLLAGVAGGVFWLPPAGGFSLQDPHDLGALGLYALFGVLLVELGSRMRRTRQRATAAEERLVLAVEGTGIGLFEVDLITATVYASPSLAALVGLPATGAPTPLRPWVESLRPEVVAESRAVLREKFRQRAEAYERELCFPAPDGRERWLLLRVRLVWDGARAVRLRGACIDMTERRATDALLRRTQAELGQQVEDLRRLHVLSNRLLEAGGLPAQLGLILDATAGFHGCRHGLLSLCDAESGRLSVAASLGFSERGLQALASVRIGDGACGLACQQRERVTVDDTESDPRFAPYRPLARQEGFRAVHSVPLINAQGQVLGALSVHLDAPRAPTERERRLADICARKAVVFLEQARAQAALEESQGRFQAVLEASAVPFGVLAPQRNPDGLIEDFAWSYLNGAAASALGQPAAALQGQRLHETLPHSWGGSLVVERFRAVAERGQTREFELHTRGDGGEAWFHCVASPIRGAVALWFADISGRKRSEQLLRDADRRKDEFLATLAHELRNPLAPIRQAALVAKAAGATEAQKRWGQEVIDRQVQRMALLLDDLLDVSRITRGVLQLRKAPVDLAAVIDAAVEIARPLLDARQHRLSVELPLQPLCFEADALRVSQVVANLLTNAAKYTDAGGCIRLIAGGDGDAVTIEVSDNGIGIAPESLPEVFAMFTQLGSAGDRAGSGLGIGLALAKGLVELHGGTIAVRSPGLGGGSTFTVRLPLGQPMPHDGERGASPEGEAAHPRRVLVADDNRDAAQSLALLLQLQGHAPVLAFDGEEALAVYEAQHPQVCLLDIGMPRRSGHEVARAIRASAGGELPVLIAITGWGQQQDRRESLAAGFDHHLTKPIDPQRLAALLAGGRGERAAAVPAATAPHAAQTG